LVGSRERRGSSPSNDSESTTIGCSRSFRGGAPLSTLPCGVACGARGGPSLEGVSAHTRRCHRFNQLPPQAVTGSIRRPQATNRRAVIFEVQPHGALAAPGGEPRRVSCDSLPAALPKEGGLRKPSVLERAPTGGGGNIRITPMNIGAGYVCREESVARWMCSCVAKIVAEVVRQRRTQKSVCSSFHTKGRHARTGV